MTDLDRILQVVCGEYGQQRHALLSTTRGRKDAAWARQVAMYLSWRLSPQPCYTEVGTAFARDRTTVRHACAKVLASGDAKVSKLEARLVRTASTV